ncbi:MAG: 4Fe-4S dicluster domain-containing protein, partial [Actinobacteria bacterium]|nr:4Fe-4S dicluster domain-containing protein [Actinomycetota bacterium]
IFFWGCTIPGRLPFLEKSLRMVLDELGVRYVEIDGFTCCPEKFLIETMSEEAWYLTAARNLALAEREGRDLLVACNGCYSSFRSAINAFYSSSELREKVAGRLKEIGLEYSFQSTVRHIVEVFHDNIGPEVIGRKVVNPLIGLRVGAHYGCQLLRPVPAVRADSPMRPTKLDKLINALGATSMEYNSKMNCCGEALGRSGQPEESMTSARVKLLELHQLKADGLVVVCPACFQQFETQQGVIQRQIEDMNIPVFYYTELLGLALGLDPGEMGLGMHRINTQRFFDRWKEEEALRNSIPDVFDYDAMKACVVCESCSNDCPVVQIDSTFNPHEIIMRVLHGETEQILNENGIWKCLECGTCTELCPNNFGMMKVFKEAKRLAMDKGVLPPETRQGIDMFQKTGMLGKPRERARSKLGLDKFESTGGEELARLLQDTFKEDKK